MQEKNVVIVGAGAAGLMCAIECAKRGRSVTIIEKSNKPGRKILMSGGGRCNFTNYFVSAENYLSHTSDFCRSALSRYTQWDFIDWVQRSGIPFHEKTLGQLFCDRSSRDILDMLLKACDHYGVTIILNTSVQNFKIQALEKERFLITTEQETYAAEAFVIATGGLSIPSMGSSSFAYEVAEQMGLSVQPTRAGLVPFVLNSFERERFSVLSGISAEVMVENQGMIFRENLLFTHRGLSGPAILQISSYWHPGESITIRFLPHLDLLDHLQMLKKNSPKTRVKALLGELLSKRMVEVFLPASLYDKNIADCSYFVLQEIKKIFQEWRVTPLETEGYKTAEVTLGGVDCHALSSKTMEVKTVPGLYFVGEAVDVTGWLGGYNFQWAWASGWAAGCVA